MNEQNFWIGKGEPALQSRRKGAAGADGFERLLRYFRLPAVRFPSQVQSTEQKVVYLNERTTLVFTPMVLEGSWYRTSAGAILANNRDGSPCAVLPDWRGRYYLAEGDVRRRTYVNARNSQYFERKAYVVTMGMPETVTSRSLLQRLLSGIGSFEAGLLLLWCLLGSGLIVLLSALLYQVVSAAVMAADVANILQTLGMMGAGLLLGLLILYSGRQTIRRTAQKAALELMPAIGERLYTAQRPPCPAATARRLAELRDKSEQLVSWGLRLLCGLLTGWASALFLADVSTAAVTSVLLISCTLTALAVLVFAGNARPVSTDSADGAQYEWMACRTRDKRLGVQRPFPFAAADRAGEWQRVACFAAPLCMVPLLWIAVVQELSLPRFLQGLALSIPAVVLSLQSLMKAPGAGRAWADVRALLPDAQIKSHENLELPPLGSVLELKNVTFAYPGRREPVLRDVSLRLYPGETVGICGKTGAGKTTLARLMTGLLEPDSGNVYYGGIELSRYNPESLLRRIALENGEDIQLLERAPEQTDTRTRVVFASRRAELLQCSRVFVLSGGILSESPQGVERA